MKKNSIIKSATSITLLAALALTGCSATSASNASATATSATSTSASSTSDTTSKVADSFSTDVKSGAKLAEDTHYSAKDVTWDSSSEVTIDLSNPTATDGVTVSDGVITITKAGNYKLTGTYSGQIKVEAADSDMVRLILNNATITNSTGAAINVVEADEVVIYTASGTTNTVSDGSSYSDTASPDAAIYSKSDLTLAGEGTLKVEGKYEEGIHTTDGLVIASGTLEVNAANTGIKGKDYVDILDGTITVTATKDGIKATNDTDGNRGWVRLSGGTVNISAGDDGFKAERVLEISGGTLNITQSNEGIEAQYINILDGTVNVTSSDDGINASYSTTSTSTKSASTSTTQTTQSKQAAQGNQSAPQAPSGSAGQAPAGGQAPSGTMGSGTTGQPPAGGGARGGMGGGGGTFEVVDATINITGGTVTVNANGDGIDSNGTATLSGGTLIVNGPFTGGNASLDTNGDLLLNGTTVAAGNSGDMFEAPSTSSTSGYVKISNVSNLSAGTTVQVTDSSGNVVANYKVTNSNTALILVSSSKITKGESYTVYTTTDSVDASSATLASNATSLGSFTAS
ncbi:carbohydrate-binding domain-containing protein [Rothia mucilaginosa]|nr:carbohydrate-binding domain-containing protein [uncultured Rothia sp.]